MRQTEGGSTVSHEAAGQELTYETEAKEIQLLKTLGESEKVVKKPKVVKRYQNRKLYDTQQSCYVTLDDISRMVKNNEEVQVIDNRTKNDITAFTMTQIIFEAERRASQYAPLFTLREIIQTGNGSISNYLAKLGAFPPELMLKETPINTETITLDEIKAQLDQRINKTSTNQSSDHLQLISGVKREDLPTLPLPIHSNFFNK